MITVELSTYTTAAMHRPMIVASGTLRDGFSMTPADTVALSMPMYAHSAMEAARDTAWASEPPLTFQPLKNVAGSNQNQPSSAIPTIGIERERHRPRFERADDARPEDVGEREQPDEGGRGEHARHGGR